MTEFTTEQIEEINRLVEENKNRLSELSEKVQAINAEIEKHQEAMANSATSVDELNRLQEQGYITAQQYGNAIKEVMETEFEAEGLDSDAANDVADAFREMADAGVEGMEALRNDEEAVKDATVRYMKLNEAIEDIYDNYDDYTDVLKDVRNATSKADRAMAANTNSAKKLKTSMAGLLGTTEDMIDADFLATIDPDDFEAAANGNADAIERIRNQFIDLQAQMYECESEADAFK
jgi:chromosome segregation ATPase